MSVCRRVCRQFLEKVGHVGHFFKSSSKVMRGHDSAQRVFTGSRHHVSRQNFLRLIYHTSMSGVAEFHGTYICIQCVQCLWPILRALAVGANNGSHDDIKPWSGEARSQVQASLTIVIQSRLPNTYAHRTLLYHANASCRRALVHSANDSGHVDLIKWSGEAQGRVQALVETFIPSSLPNRVAYRTPIHRAHASWRRVYCVARQVLYAYMWSRWTCYVRKWIVKRCTLVI